MKHITIAPPKLASTLLSDLEDFAGHPLLSELTEELRQHVHDMRNLGYAIVDSSVSEETVDAALAAFERWKATNSQAWNANRKPNGHPPRVVDFHSEIDEVAALFYKNRALILQDILFGAETSIYSSLFFEVSTEQPIHRDVPVFRTSPENFYFGMWVALEDATLENGTLEVVEGGHSVDVDQYEIGKRFHKDPFDIPHVDEEMWNAYQAEVVSACRGKKLLQRHVEIKRGQTLIWHPLLPHGGGHILREGRTRRSVVFHTVPLGVPVYRQDVFFNAEASNVTCRSAFTYKTMPGGRSYADFGGVKLVGR